MFDACPFESTGSTFLQVPSSSIKNFKKFGVSVQSPVLVGRGAYDPRALHRAMAHIVGTPG